MKIWLISFLGIISLIRATKDDDKYQHYLDRNSVSFDRLSDDGDVTFSLASNNTDNEIQNFADGSSRMSCYSGKVVPLIVSLKREHLQIRVPLNVSCEMLDPLNMARNLTMQQQHGVLHLYWNVTNIRLRYYAILWMGKEYFGNTVVPMTQGRYILYNVSEGHVDRICVASIDDQWRTSKYRCVTKTQSPPPVTNMVVHALSRKAYLTWETLDTGVYDHEGYIVNITSRTGPCRTLIINMRQHCIKAEERCLNARTIRWAFLQPLELTELTPNTHYKVSISNVRHNRVSRKSHITLTTKIEETVSNIRVSLKESQILVEFNVARRLENSATTYRLKVIVNSINMCTSQSRTIFDEVINSTKKYVDLIYWNYCCDYRIEVTPLHGCTPLESGYPATSVTFRPDAQHHPHPLIGLSAVFLSSNLLKVSWNNSIVEDECGNFGLMAELTNIVNSSDCKTWTIAKKMCIKLINRSSMFSKCKNEEYLRLDSDVIITNILLHGQFKSSTDYRFQLWRITEDIQPLFRTIMNRTESPDCFLDCYDSTYHGLRSATSDGRMCLPWKDFSNTTTSITSYRSNLCQVSSLLNLVPRCIHATSGLQSNCDVPKCTKISQHTKCVANTEVLSSRDSVTLMWSRMLSADNLVPGYITLLHNIDHECERYHVQSCTDCIKLLQMSISIQSLYLSCRSGSVSNDQKYETTFDGLQSNKEYFVYIAPLLDNETIGEIRKVIIGTRVSDLLSPIYIETVNRTTSSLQFQWDDNISNANYYIATLTNTKSNIQSEHKFPHGSVTFTNLDMCTEYCMLLTVVTKSGQSESVDQLCTHTLSPNPSVPILSDIETVSSSSWTIKWTPLDCSVLYRFVYWKKHSSETVTKLTNHSTVTLTNLERNIIYCVKVRGEARGNSAKEILVGGYSTIKEFFTGPVNENLSISFEEKTTINGKIKLTWKISDSSSGSMFEFVIRVKTNVNKCLTSTNHICITCPEPFKRKYLTDKELSKLKALLDCPGVAKYDFTIETRQFSSELESSLRLQDSTLTVYGVNLRGVQKLYEKRWMQ